MFHIKFGHVLDGLLDVYEAENPRPLTLPSDRKMIVIVLELDSTGSGGTVLPQ